MSAQSSAIKNGPVHALRRAVLPKIARLLLLFAALLLTLWLAGQVWTDEHHLTQYLFWMPTSWVLGTGWALVMLAWLIERCSLRLAGVQLRALVTLALIILTFWHPIANWRVHRLLGPKQSGDLRVLYWNMTVGRDMRGAPELVHSERPDIAIIANPRTDGLRGPLLRSLAELGQQPSAAQDEAETSELQTDVGPTRLLFRHEIALATRGRIEAWGSATFTMDNRDDETHRGVVMFAVVHDVLDEPITLWIVDLPSYPTLWRQDVTQAATEAVQAWRGPIHELSETGQWTPRMIDSGFPEPDFIVGDFNIPRGSDSLQTLVVDRVESFAAVGFGPGATWNRKWPAWAIDMLFASPGWQVRRHRVVDPGMSMHRMIVVELAR